MKGAAARRLLLAGAAATVLGLVVAGTAPIVATAGGPVHAQQTIGGVLVLAGWALLGYGIHRFGRESE